ncbi:hypothetical protein ACNTMW_01900 [Planosporangium sp. 12N6]|uniref:hypothetical protein n=1 Tax=Planosporangium spinosum TaxID=3402278 RepID=UPI003CFB6CC7
MPDDDVPPTSTPPIIHPQLLTWSEVDPARHPFDHDAAPAVVRALPPAATVPTRPSGRAADPAVIAWSRREGDRWAKAMSAALVEHYGRWAGGWRWALDEGDFDGGPVGAWCCPRDSMTTPEATLTVVTEALREWRGWLEDLAERFPRFLPLPADAPADVALDTWERAVAHLVTVVVDRTGGGSGWYRHCAQVLEWFLTAAGVPEERHDPLIDGAVGGRFESWSTPSNLVIADVAGRLAADITRPPDA